MKILLKILLTLPVVLFATGTYAGTDAGTDTAKYYKTFPNKWDGKKISLDCVSVNRINGSPQIEDIVFFNAQTFDDKNNAPGGGIVIAILAGDVESFIRKYGTVIERTRGRSDRVENKRLTGIFHQLERGHIYLDASGEAHDLILSHKENAKRVIRHGDGIPEDGDGHQGHKKHKRRR